MKSWTLLLVAGLLEMGWAVGLKYTEGFTRLWPSVWTIVALIASMTLLGIALKQLPVGTAYPVWVGIGALGAAVYGMTFFGEPLSVWRVIFLLMLVIAIVGLKLTSASGLD